MLRGLAIFLLTVLPAALPAQTAQFYECDMDVDIPNGWISPKIGIIFGADGKATVIDSVIIAFFDEPRAARARKRGDRIRLNWTINNAYDDNQQIIPTFNYTAWLDPKARTLSVVAKPARFPQRFSGKGVCKLRTDAKGFRLK